MYRDALEKAEEFETAPIIKCPRDKAKLRGWRGFKGHKREFGPFQAG